MTLNNIYQEFETGSDEEFRPRPNFTAVIVNSENNPLVANASKAGDTLANLNPRVGFVRKVYSIICCQLLLTSLICYLAVASEAYRSFLFSKAGIILFIISICLTSLIMAIISCCISVARFVPVNYIILGVFTLCESHIISYECVFVEPKIVAMAAVMTLGVTLSLTAYAMTTNEDITYMGGALFIIACGLLLFGVFALFTDHDVVNILYCLLAIFLYGFYLIYDTQLIMGGGTHEISLDDYILAAIIIYLDIIILFVRLLRLLKRTQPQSPRI